MAAVMPRAARRIAEPQVPPAAWRQWLEQRITIADRPLVPYERRLVVLAPHPDDEVLACALLMQQHVANGGALHLVAATDGEASHAEAGWPVQELQAIRCAERKEGLARLGLGHIPVSHLHLPDGAVAEAGGRLHAAMLALLRPGDVLVTTWHLDGHPDHECCGRVALDVARRMQLLLLQAPVWMWHWARPGMAEIDWAALCAVEAPVSAQVAKAQALQAHRSQLLPRSDVLPAVLDAAILERAAWQREYFFV